MKNLFGMTTICLYAKVYQKELVKFLAKRKRMSMAQFIVHVIDVYVENEIKTDKRLKERSLVLQYLRCKKELSK